MVKPSLIAFRELLDSMRAEEMRRYRGKVSPEAEEMLDRALQSMSKRIMHHPAQQLRDAEGETQHGLVRAFRHLFGFDTR